MRVGSCDPAARHAPTQPSQVGAGRAQSPRHAHNGLPCPSQKLTSHLRAVTTVAVPCDPNSGSVHVAGRVAWPTGRDLCRVQTTTPQGTDRRMKSIPATTNREAVRCQRQRRWNGCFADNEVTGNRQCPLRSQQPGSACGSPPGSRVQRTRERPDWNGFAGATVKGFTAATRFPACPKPPSLVPGTCTKRTAALQMLDAQIVCTYPCAFPAWGHSSVGRALQWHCRGRRFDPVWLHQPNKGSARKG